MKIVFTGGHHNSALVVAQKLKSAGEAIVWFGHKYSILGDKNPSAEFVEVTGCGIPFVDIQAGKYQPKYRFLTYLVRIPFGFLQSLWYLLQTKPDLVFSFGGYLALPVALMAWLLGIPVVTHEQTTSPGKANRFIGLIAKRVFLTFPDTKGCFPRSKVLLTGLPLRPEIFAGRRLLPATKKTLYVTGGKQGGHLLNEAIFSLLPVLVANYQVIHQCGSNTLFADYAQAETLKKALTKNSSNYLPFSYVPIETIGSVFHTADLVISRAGAHTICELLALNKPALLVPLTWSSGNEQVTNAEFLKSAGLAEILPQDQLTPTSLLALVTHMMANLPNYQVTGLHNSNSDAVDRIIAEIKHLS